MLAIFGCILAAAVLTIGALIALAGGGDDGLLPNLRQPDLELQGMWNLECKQTCDLPQVSEAKALIALTGNGGRDVSRLDMPLWDVESAQEHRMFSVRQEEALIALAGGGDDGLVVPPLHSVQRERQSQEVLVLQQEAKGGVGEHIQRATEYWGVEWAAGALVIVRFRESSNRLEPCVVGLSGELGPYQFMPSTWASTPYAKNNPCDLEAATWAAAWFVSEGRWLEWTTWPR